MVNSIPNMPNSPDVSPRISTDTAATSSAKISTTKTEFSVQQSDKGNAENVTQNAAKLAAVTSSGGAADLASQALNPPFTSLALYKDPESGLQISVVRDKLTGEVEQIPTERMRRLAAMYKEQADMSAAQAATRDTTQLDV